MVLVCVGVCVCIQPKRLIKLKKIKKVKDMTFGDSGFIYGYLVFIFGYEI